LWLVAGGWFVLREKYCWLVADKPSEQAAYAHGINRQQASTRRQMTTRWQAAIAARIVELGLSTRGET
jgi:hypothetical protein